MSAEVFIGIDTSNYTTSVGVVDADGNLLANLKKLLPVKTGERGLRQSDAVFAHVKNLPELMDEARAVIGDGRVAAVGVSTRPRNREGSYMPCFLVGINAAKSMMAATGAPLYEFSHQCGHIMAALYSSKKEISGPFAAFHVSGGTTELVLAERSGLGFVCRELGGTCDVNAGQVIDRIGVHMGMPFPAGKYMQTAALANTAPIPKRKPPVKGTRANLSGLENMAIELYTRTQSRELVAAFVFEYLGGAIEMMCDGAVRELGCVPFVFAGGVMSNSIIRARLEKRFDATFAEPELSSDNAVGIAILAQNAYKYEKGKRA